jgi:hypothetical protein
MSYRVIETTTLFKVCQHAEVKTEVCAKIPLATNKKHRRWSSQDSRCTASSKSLGNTSASSRSSFDDDTGSCTTSGSLGGFLRTVFWAMFKSPSSSSKVKTKASEKSKRSNHKPPQHFIQAEGLCSICTRKAEDEKNAAREASYEQERARKINQRKLKFRCEKCVKEERYPRDRSINEGLCCEFGRAFWAARGYENKPSAPIPAQVRKRARAPSVNAAIGTSHRTGTTTSSMNHLTATADRARSRARAHTTNASSSTTPTRQAPFASPATPTAELSADTSYERNNSLRRARQNPDLSLTREVHTYFPPQPLIPSLAAAAATHTQALMAPSIESQRAIPLYQTLHLDTARWDSQIPATRGTYPAPTAPAPTKPLPAVPKSGSGKNAARSSRKDVKEGSSKNKNTSSRKAKDHKSNRTSTRTAEKPARAPMRNVEQRSIRPSTSSSVSSFASSQVRPMATEMAKLDKRISRELMRWETFSQVERENFF